MPVNILETNGAHRRDLTSSKRYIFRLRSSDLVIRQTGTNISEEPAFSIFRPESNRLHGRHCGLYTVAWMCGIADKCSRLHGGHCGLYTV